MTARFGSVLLAGMLCGTALAPAAWAQEAAPQPGVEQPAAPAAQPPAGQAAAPAATPAEEPFARLRGDPNAIQTGEATEMRVGDLIGRDVVNQQAEPVGTIDRLIEIEGEFFAVLGSGGFLGLGEEEVALPMESMRVRGDELVVPGLTDEQIDALAQIDETAGQELTADQQIPVATAL